MPKKIEDIKNEQRGAFKISYRTTSKDDKGKIGVSNWRRSVLARANIHYPLYEKTPRTGGVLLADEPNSLR
jgi:hypothetical protein